MNLINDPWLPVRRLDGNREIIAPWQITDAHDSNPIVSLDLPRPDLNGGMLEYLIGALQTAVVLSDDATTEDDADWLDRLEEPPTPAQLKNWFKPFSHAFQLDGNGPRFMQELGGLDGEAVSVQSLFIDIAGTSSLFIKPGRVVGLSPAAAAMALYTLQSYSPAGGRGYRTSLRGGGPLTTLVMFDSRAMTDGTGPTLWRDLWLNVLPGPRFLRLAGNPARRELADIFPWLAPTRTSEAGSGRPTTPEEVHPLQMFWGMPRRVYLDFQGAPGRCSVLDTDTDTLITQCAVRHGGVNYEGAWRHPLTPHVLDKNTRAPLPRHAQPGGLGYRHWIGLVYAAQDQLREPAAVVSAQTARLGVKSLGGTLRVRALGYDMDNMKPRCWYEQQLPVYHVPPIAYDIFVNTAEGLINAAEEARSYLVGAVKQAWFKRPGDAKGNMTFLDLAFWEGTETDFYGCLASLVEGFDQDSDADALRLGIRQRWHEVLARQALALFERWAASGRLEYEDPKRIAAAYQKLRSLLYGKKLRENILELPKPIKSRKGALADES